MRFFKSVKTTITNIAQILLICILLPIVAMLCYIFTSNTPGSDFFVFVCSLVDEIPLCNMIFAIISEYVSVSSDFNISNITLLVFLKAFPETILVGALSHFFCRLYEHNWSISRAAMDRESARNYNPLPIFPTFLGIASAAILVNLFELFADEMAVFLIEVVFVIILIVALKSIFGRKLKLFSTEKILLLIIDGIYAIILSVYISGMFVVSVGLSSDVKETLSLVSTLVVTTLIATVIVWFIRKCSQR